MNPYLALLIAITIVSFAYTSVVTNSLIRLSVGITDITIGIMTLLDPEYALHEIGGYSLPYFFHDKYDDQTYQTGFDG